MADAVLDRDDGKCLLLTYNKSGHRMNIFKLQAVEKLIECATELHDNETHSRMQAIFNSQGKEASVEIHKSYYCSSTSKNHIKKIVARKRKDGSIDNDEAPVVRIRRSQVINFDFKKHCLLCAMDCEPVNPNHPDRWDRVVQYERKGVKNAPPFKTVLMQYCDDRNDVWSRQVAIHCHGVHDLAAAEAQYHIRCYDEFRKIPTLAGQTSMIDDAAMKLLVDEMYTKRKLCTWTSIELHDKYMSYGGQLTRKQMFTKMVLHLGDDV